MPELIPDVTMADIVAGVADLAKCHLCGKDGVVKEQKNLISIRRDEWRCTDCNVSRVVLYNNKCYPKVLVYSQVKRLV